jgi:membrane protease YdiL (CAAX protease family)
VTVVQRVPPHLLGIAGFVGATFALTVATVALLAPVWSNASAATVWRPTLAYVVAVGWQPFAAVWIVRRRIDAYPSGHTHRAARRRYTVLAIALAVTLLAGATIVEATLGTTTTSVGAPLPPATTLAGFVGSLVLLCAQALIEESTWRGYLMPRLMQAVGPWPGLCVHGLLWGACYAPVFLRGTSTDAAQLLGVIVTCGLLGIILGWLRLASGSVAPSTLCNAALTIGGGLPLLMRGATSPFAAVFAPAGWLPMMLIIATIATQPSLRRAVALRRP